MPNLFQIFRVLRYLVIIWAFARVTNVAADPVRVGMILPLTGNASGLGQNLRKSAELSFDKLPKEQQSLITLAFEDDELVPTKSVTAFNKLVAESNIDVVVTATAGPSNAVSPLAESKRIPMFAITVHGGVSNGRRYVLRHYTLPTAQNSVLLPELKRREFRSVAIVGTIDEALNEVFHDFELRAPNFGLDIVLKETFNPDERDFRTFLSKLKKRNPEVIVAAFKPPQTAVFFKQLREFRLTQPVFGYGYMENLSEVKAAQGAMDGIYYSATEASASFQKAYADRFSDIPQVGAGNIYDIVQIIAQAAERSGRDREKLNDYFHSLRSYSGVTGKYGATADNCFDVPAVLKQIRGEQFQMVSRNDIDTRHNNSSEAAH